MEEKEFNPALLNNEVLDAIVESTAKELSDSVNKKLDEQDAAVALEAAAPLVEEVLQNPVVPALLAEKNLAPVPHIRVGSIVFKNPA